ncbi:hypothetical protein DRJ48_01095, partial [Candidatus Woesearchaeota archaeon]
GTEVLNVVFSATDLVNGSLSIPGPTIAQVSGLMPGQVKQVNFSISIPDSQFAAIYSGVINASDSEANDSVELVLEVNSVPEFSINPTSIVTTIAQGFSGDESLTIDNLGNSGLSNVVITFSDLTKEGGTDTIPSSSISVSENNFDVAYQGQKTITITINVPAGTPVGTYNGTFEVTSNGVTESGSLAVSVEEPVGHLEAPTELTATNLLRDRTYTKVFTVINDGDFDLGNVVLTSTASSKYNVSFSNVPSTINAGESKQISVTFYVPKDEASGLHTIGDIKITTDKYNTSFPLKIDPKVMLRVRDLDIFVNGRGHDVDVNGGDTVEIDPDSKVEVRAKIENLYSDDDDVDIENVVLRATIKDIDEGDDLEEESNEIKIRADDKETISVTFDIPLKVEADTYDLENVNEGEDD